MNDGIISKIPVQNVIEKPKVVGAWNDMEKCNTDNCQAQIKL